MLSAKPFEMVFPGARFEAASRVAAARFGLDLSKYPAPQIEALLAVLPDELSPDDDASVRRLLSVCSVGETMFWRHPEQLAALAKIVAEGRVGEAHRPLVIWSAGCATGEEAYSLAALFSSRPGGVRVLGTDVSERAIERARAGQYQIWSLRGVEPSAVSDFLDIDARGAEVRQALRRHVEFRVHNLNSDPFPDGVDVIVCRNVLMYFRSDAAAAVVRRFHRALRPGGALFLGYVDVLPTVEPFVEAWHGSVRYHRKAAPAENVLQDAPIQKQSKEPTTPPPAARRPSSPRITPVPLAGDFRASATKASITERLALARGLAGHGAREAALEKLTEITREHPLEVEPHVLFAMIADEANLGGAALEAARRAYFLAPEAPVTIFMFATCLEHMGEAQKAERHFIEARRALEKHLGRAEPLPFGQGLLASDLRRAIDGRARGT